MSLQHVVAEPRRQFAHPPLRCDRLPAVHGAIWLRLVGELDLVTADLARDAISRAQAYGRTVICHLSDVRFVDVSGLRVLLDASAHARLTGCRLTIAGCPPIVPRMLELLGLGDALDIRQPPRPASPECGQRRRRIH